MSPKDKRIAWAVGIYVVGMALVLGLFVSTSCVDGWLSPSIGKSGACSWHGGVKQTGGWTFWVWTLVYFYLWRSWTRKNKERIALADEEWKRVSESLAKNELNKRELRGIIIAWGALYGILWIIISIFD